MSVLKSHMDTASSFIAGEAGLCLKCGEEIDKYLYCNDCLEDMGYDICFCCGDAVHHGNGNEVHDLETGESVVVCDACYDSEVVECNCCERDVFGSQAQYLSGIGRVCDECAENYEKCDWCNNYGNKEETHDAIDHDGTSITVCEYCYNSRFSECKECDDAYPLSALRDGFCPECFPRVSRETLGRA